MGRLGQDLLAFAALLAFVAIGVVVFVGIIHGLAWVGIWPGP